jgi:hypothetical protein
MHKNYLGLFLSVFIGLSAFFANINISGPTIQSDEGSYLLNAAAIAGYNNDFSSKHHAGYSLFLVPAFWFAHTPHEIWVVVKLINSVLLFLTVFLLWKVSYLLRPNIGLFQRASGVFATGIYPAIFVMQGYAFPQLAFALCFVLFCLFFLLALQKKSQKLFRYWIFAGVTAGYLYWIHPTGIAAICALFLSSLILSFIRADLIKNALSMLLASGLMIFVYKVLFLPWLATKMTISGTASTLDYQSTSEMLKALISFPGILGMISRFSGSFFYLLIGSLGLLWVGLYELYVASRRTHPSKKYSDSSQIAFFVFLPTALILAAAMGAILFVATPQAMRLDHFMYGRYVDAFVLPVLLMGATSLYLRSALLAIPLAFICTFLMWLGFSEYEGIAFMNIASFWQVFYLLEGGLWVWLFSGVVLILLVGIVPRIVGLSLISIIFIISNYAQINWHILADIYCKKRISNASFIRKVYHPSSKVGFDHSGIDTEGKHVFWFDYGFILYDYKLQRCSAPKWIEESNGPFFSYDKNLDFKYSGVELLAACQAGGPFLWTTDSPNGIGTQKMNSNIWLEFGKDSSFLQRILRNGWNPMEESHIWSTDIASIKAKAAWFKQGKIPKFIILKTSAFAASPTKQVEVVFRSGEKTISRTFANSAIQEVTIPLASNASIVDVEISTPSALSPYDLKVSADKRKLGIALHGIKFSDTGIAESKAVETPLAYLLFFQSGENGVSLLKEGWNSPEATHVWSQADAKLLLPAPKGFETRECQGALEFWVFGATPDRPVDVFFESADSTWHWNEKITATSEEKMSIAFPLGLLPKSIRIRVPSATSPEKLIGTPDSRILGIALKRVSLTPISHTAELASQKYPFSFGNSGNGAPLLVSGWHPQEAEFTWSESEAILQLPLSKTAEGQTRPVVLKFFVFGASPQRSMDVFFESADPDWKWAHKLTTTEAGNLELKIPLPAGKSPRTIKISIPQAISPSELLGSPDPRILGIALRSVENEEPSIKK